MLRGLAPLQEKMKQAEAERAKVLIEGSAGGGAVRIRLRGDLTVDGVSIAPAAAAAVAGDAGMLEDLITAALGDALRRHQQRFGASAEEQLQRSLGDDVGGLLGPLLGGLGR